MDRIKFKLTIAYDGTAYHGWQSQKSGRGVQNQIETALAKIFTGNPVLESSSRTDAGVHALGMIAHFEIDPDELHMPENHLALAVNACLPADIRVLAAVRVAADFHARFDATGKQYRYQIWNHVAMNPLLHNRAWHVAKPLDLSAMRAAASQLIGRHDFRAFTSNRDGILGDSCRTLRRCTVKQNGQQVTFIIEGDGFLYKMCRAIVGTLVQIGEGKFPASIIPQVLASRDRSSAGVNAPAQGLVLWKVFYEG